ncbi:hypothetical protein PIB30_009454 [Stylosanthes scabra]|uniref:Uncharacterized protein n=1 Tax=Stylosanthes scabra TaxID=79078 RepID=A0ABU6X2K3_9FABA|nr:hypothetical protein [Stylosanthes scabra]
MCLLARSRLHRDGIPLRKEEFTGTNNTPQSSLAQPSAQSILVPQPTQVATAVTSAPQTVSTGNNNRTIFPEMSRQMPISFTPVNNTVE